MAEKDSSLQRVKKALASLGLPAVVKELPGSTRTAPEAAQAVGCQVDQIVKSLIFQGTESMAPLLILTSGANQVDPDLVATIIGEPLKFASADFVRDETGFAVGGVAPFGLKKPIQTFLDQDLLQHEVVWAAAGSPQAVFSIDPETLAAAANARVIAVH